MEEKRQIINTIYSTDLTKRFQIIYVDTHLQEVKHNSSPHLPGAWAILSDLLPCFSMERVRKNKKINFTVEKPGKYHFGWVIMVKQHW